VRIAKERLAQEIKIQRLGLLADFVWKWATSTRLVLAAGFK